MVGELTTRSDNFRTRWAAHNVMLHHCLTKRVGYRPARAFQEIKTVAA